MQTNARTHARVRALSLAQHQVAGRRYVQLLQLLSKFEECENCQADGRWRCVHAVCSSGSDKGRQISLESRSELIEVLVKIQ